MNTYYNTPVIVNGVEHYGAVKLFNPNKPLRRLVELESMPNSRGPYASRDVTPYAYVVLDGDTLVSISSCKSEAYGAYIDMAMSS